MDRLGIDVNVISWARVIQGTSWADPAIKLELVRRVNDRAANGAPRIRSASSAASCCRCRISIARCANSSAP